MQYPKVLKRISPSKKERNEVEKLASQILYALGTALPEGTETILAGSAAKGTFLSKSADIDVFAIFPKSYSKDRMFIILKNSAKKAFPKAKFEVGYAEHPYLRMQYKKKRVDIVPSYKMKKGQRVKSAVDRSQLHTGYVLSRLKEEQKKEVLLLKQFLAANLLYGAEIKTRGFSGYLCELMIIHYGGFEKFVRAASSWKKGAKIDPARLYKAGKAIPDFPAPLIVIDPVDHTRNVSAVITEENFTRLVFLCASFLKKPSGKYFFPPRPPKASLAKSLRNRSIFALSLPKPRVVDDVLWGQLWRLSAQLKSFLEKCEFMVLGTHAYASRSRCIILFEVRSPALPETQVFRGPFLNMQKDVSAFIGKHPPPFYFDEGRIHAISKRRHRSISSATSEVRKRKDAPSHFAKSLKKARLLPPKAILARFPESIEEYLKLNSPPN